MKKVTLKSMTLINFKGHRNRVVEFSEQTNIYGKNASGKSTIFDAFTWLLFGKDQFDRKDYEILPKGLDKVDAVVTAEIEVDGRPYNLRRELHQKWVRRRGTSEEVYDGNETLFYVNNVPLKASEYKARVDMIIDETVFKLITNPAYFLSLNWTKQREILFQIAGTLSDAEIAATSPEFTALMDSLSGKSFAEFKKEIAARKRKLKEDLENIQPRIDQTTRLMPEAKDVEQLNTELAGIEKQITEVEDSIADRSAAIRTQYEGVQQKQKDINMLKSQQQELVFKKKQEAQNAQFEGNQKRAVLDGNLKTATRNLEQVRRDKGNSEIKVNNLKRQVTSKEKEIETLRDQWHEQNKAEYKAQDGCLTCPVFNITCTDTQATAKHEEAQEKAKNAFFESKQKKLDNINSEGADKGKELNALNDSVKEAEKQLKNDTDAVNEAEIEVQKIQEELKAMPIMAVATVIQEELPEWNDLEKEIKDIQATIQEVKPVDNADLLEQKKELTAKRDALKDILSKQALIPQYEAEVKKLAKEAAELAQQIADIEKQEFTIAEFTRAKIEESEARINSLFRIVKFQLFDKTIDGNEFECCIATNLKNVPISATNTAEQVNAGLDIVNTLCNFNNVTAPIFCDGRESVNDIIPMSSQIINLVVTRDPELVIN
ncbi:MAG: hypothetical protein EOM80_16545 [Erysipelotrichia bacterium]|nr:hypothetical protein [Erysipelotrichia bacterium]